MGGVNLGTVQTLLGHKDLRMTMRHSHLSPEHLREAASALDKDLDESIHNQEAQIGKGESSQP
jgi:integrase